MVIEPDPGSCEDPMVSEEEARRVLVRCDRPIVAMVVKATDIARSSSPVGAVRRELWPADAQNSLGSA